MKKELRTVGIPGTDQTPWGAHFCHFYQTNEGLMDLLVPYFKAGLENNEFCLWATLDPLDEKAARNAMRKAVPKFERYVQDGQIEIVPYSEWYLRDGDFVFQRFLRSLVEKLDQALSKGYDGLRMTGNAAWLEKTIWKDFAEYEDALDGAIEKHKMLILCTYPLDKCDAAEVIDATWSHQFTLVERSGRWGRIERAELRRDRRGATGQAGSLHLLSKREREVFELVALGHTNQEVAGRLNLSVKTVETYRIRLMEKLGLKSRVDLVRYALAAGVLKPIAN